jgi:hypothetical protein
MECVSEQSVEKIFGNERGNSKRTEINALRNFVSVLYNKYY